MPGPAAEPLSATPRQRRVLEQLVRRHTSPQQQVRRARVVRAALDGASTAAAGRRVGMKTDAARVWRRRWAAAAEALLAAEAEGGADDDRALEVVVAGVLADAPRPGAPPTFTPEQLCQVMAIACEPPGDSGRPISQWTPRELAEEAITRNIVPRISARTVGPPPAPSGGFWFLEVAALKPHRSRYWLTPRERDPDVLAQGIETVCTVYAQAPAIAARGGHVVSTAEMTGIQALERAAPTRPVRPGRVERREFEYVRHGTQCLIANWDVVLGRVVSPTVSRPW